MKYGKRGSCVLGPHEIWSHNLRHVQGGVLGVFEVLRVLGGMVKMAKTIDLGCFKVSGRFEGYYGCVLGCF